MRTQEERSSVYGTLCAGASGGDGGVTAAGPPNSGSEPSEGRELKKLFILSNKGNTPRVTNSTHIARSLSRAASSVVILFVPSVNSKRGRRRRSSGMATVVVKALANGVQSLELCGPRANALNLHMMKDIASFIRGAAASPSTTGIILTSTSPTSFCSGLDLREVCTLATTNNREKLYEYYTAMDECFKAAPRAPVPVVAALDGHAIAG